MEKFKYYEKTGRDKEKMKEGERKGKQWKEREI